MTYGRRSGGIRLESERASASLPTTMTGAAIVRSIVDGIAADRRAVALEDLGLVPEHLETEREPVGHVGVLGRDLERPLLAAATDQDRAARPAGSVAGTLSASSIR